MNTKNLSTLSLPECVGIVFLALPLLFSLVMSLIGGELVQ